GSAAACGSRGAGYSSANRRRAVRYRAVVRDDAKGASLVGSILVHDVREANGAPGLAKGRRLNDGDVAHLARLQWEELHVLDLEPGDVHEDEAGKEHAGGAAGGGGAVGPHSAGRRARGRHRA